MKLHRIVAKDSRAAQDEAIARFGRDVLIVSNSRIHGQTELVVAVDIAEETPPQTHAPAHPSTDASATAQRPGFTATLDRLLHGAPPQSTPAPLTPRCDVAAPIPQADPPEVEAKPTTTPSIDPALHQMVRTTVETLLRASLQELTPMVRPPAAGGVAHQANQALAEVACPGSLRALLVAALPPEADLSTDSIPSLWQPLLQSQWDDLSATAPNGRSTASYPPGVYSFSGPAGCGKTQALLALGQSLAQAPRTQAVALVQWQDPRPGAWAHLQLQAAQRGLTVYRAQDTATLALLQQDQPDTVFLMETLSPSGDPSAHAARLRAELPHAQHQVILAADTPAASIRRWLPDGAAPWSGLWISRLDEATQPWPLLHACLGQGLAPRGAVQHRSDGIECLDFGIPDLIRCALDSVRPFLQTDRSAPVELPPVSASQPVPQRKADKSIRVSKSRRSAPAMTAGSGAQHG